MDNQQDLNNKNNPTHSGWVQEPQAAQAYADPNYYYYQQNYPGYEAAYAEYYNYYQHYPQNFNYQAPPPPSYPNQQYQQQVFQPNFFPPPPMPRANRPAQATNNNPGVPPPPPPANDIPPPPPEEDKLNGNVSWNQTSKGENSTKGFKKYGSVKYEYTENSGSKFKENKFNRKTKFNAKVKGFHSPTSSTIMNGPYKKFSEISISDSGLANTNDTFEENTNLIGVTENETISLDGSKNPKNNNIDSKNDEELPDYVRAWVQKIYEAYPNAKSNGTAQQIIYGAINKVYQTNSIWSVNWSKKPIPKAIVKLFANVQVITGKKAGKAKSKRQKSPSPPIIENVSHEELQKRLMRQARFAQPLEPETLPPPPTVATEQHMMDVIDWDKDTVIGTCTNLEKNYFRLTSAPDPSKIRPVEVLKKTLKLLVKKWEENKDYTYICDQFQSVRQDLTVQRIKNNFTVYVYETFSRIALEKNDIGEFNKCQSQLKDLYEYGIEGNENEFICYRMLYFIYTRSSAEIKKMISNLTEQQEKDENIAFSLKVLRALNTSEFYTFFRLYNSATQYCKIIISFFLERERYKAMDIICMAYLPDVTLDYVKDIMGFLDEDECINFLKSCGITLFQCPKALQNGNQNVYRFQTKPVRSMVKARLNKLSKVDIKGQLN